MKKTISILALLLLGLVLPTACSSDSDDANNGANSQKTENYLKVENATYTEGSMPQATISEKPKVQLASTVQKGGKSVIRIAKDNAYTKLFIGIKGLSGYWVFTPSNTTRSDGDDEYWDIPFDGGDNADGDVTVQVSAQTENGDVTQPYEQTLSYVDGPSVRVKSILVKDYPVKGKNLPFMTFTYNEQGKVTSFYHYGDGTLKIYWNGNTIVSIDDIEDGTHYTVSQNSRGYITQMQGRAEDYSDNSSLDYDEEGHLIHGSGSGNDDGDIFNTDIRFTWFDGTLTMSQWTSSEDAPSTFTYTYGQYENVLQQVFAFNTDADVHPGGIGIFGKASTKLPVKAVSGSTTYVYSYTFNADGSINTQTITRNGSQTMTLEYSY